MRDAFVRRLTTIAEADPKVMLITADLGFGVLTPFAERFPKQFINAGVAEQNMTALATGLALEGFTVLTYSIANFPILRCLEQVRNDVCYHKCDVKIVAVGGGMAYGTLGISHHATEDIAVMRSMPGMTVLAPNDPVEADAMTAAMMRFKGPCYLRLGRASEENAHAGPLTIGIGDVIQMTDGGDAVVFATGGLLAECMKAAAACAASGIGVRVISVPTVAPLAVDAIARHAAAAPAVFTVEEHSIIGGLGSAVSEALMESSVRPPHFQRIGLRDGFTSAVGSQDYLRRFYGVDADSIECAIRRGTSK
jgi:transketolase